MKEIFII